MALPQDLSTLDYTSDGLPFYTSSAVGSLETLDVAYEGLPLGANDAPAQAPMIRITAPQASTDSLRRKFPLARLEFVASNSPTAHSFPFVSYQESSYLP